MSFYENNTDIVNYILDNDKYKKLDNVGNQEKNINKFNDPALTTLYYAIHQSKTIQDILKVNKIELNYSNLNKTRVMLTTSEYPFFISANGYVKRNKNSVIKELENTEFKF